MVSKIFCIVTVVALAAFSSTARADIEGFGPVRLGVALSDVASVVKERPGFHADKTGLFYRAIVGGMDFGVSADVNAEGKIQKVTVEKLGMTGTTTRDSCTSLYTSFAQIFQDRYGEPKIAPFYVNVQDIMATLYFGAWEDGDRSITVEGEFGFYGPDEGSCNNFVATYRDAPLDVADHPAIKARAYWTRSRDRF